MGRKERKPNNGLSQQAVDLTVRTGEYTPVFLIELIQCKGHSRLTGSLPVITQSALDLTRVSGILTVMG